MGEVLWANNCRQKVLIHNLPTPTMWLPTYNMLIIRVAHNSMKLCWEIRLQSGWLLINVGSGRRLIVWRYLYLRIIPIRVINNWLLYLRLLPLSGWDGFIIIGVHYSTTSIMHWSFSSAINQPLLLTCNNDFIEASTLSSSTPYAVLANKHSINACVNVCLVW